MFTVTGSHYIHVHILMYDNLVYLPLNGYCCSFNCKGQMYNFTLYGKKHANLDKPAYLNVVYYKVTVFKREAAV